MTTTLGQYVFGFAAAISAVSILATLLALFALSITLSIRMSIKDKKLHAKYRKRNDPINSLSNFTDHLQKYMEKYPEDFFVKSMHSKYGVIFKIVVYAIGVLAMSCIGFLASSPSDGP